jgi:succinate dehydrogenase/fumarate reductase cytochrome b subunit
MQGSEGSQPAGAGRIVDETERRSRQTRERAWRRAQAVSGLLFLVFALLHLVNTMLAAWSAEAYDGFQHALRPFYQHPALEIGLVMGPLLVHVAAALRRVRLDGVRRRGGNLRARLHRITGYFLLLVIFGHIAAVRGPSWFGDVFLDFAGVSFSLWILPSYFSVYYTALAVVALYHGANGALLAAARLSIWVPSFLHHGPGFWLPLGAGAVLIVLGLLGLGGRLYAIPDPSDNAYAQMWRELGAYEWIAPPPGS